MTGDLTGAAAKDVPEGVSRFLLLTLLFRKREAREKVKTGAAAKDVPEGVSRFLLLPFLFRKREVKEKVKTGAAAKDVPEGVSRFLLLTFLFRKRKVREKVLQFYLLCAIMFHAAFYAAKKNRQFKEVNMMKEGIHPKYEQTVMKCACGETINTGSTRQNIKLEICSKCHPFYTGKQKLVDTGGRVDRFNRKFGLK